MRDNNNLIEDDISEDESPDEEIAEIVENYNLDQDTAERVHEIMDEYGYLMTSDFIRVHQNGNGQ